MNLYFDTEFTGLHQDTTLISIGIVSDEGDSFYAELSDYNLMQVDDWIEKNVINKLKFSDKLDGYLRHYGEGKHTIVKADQKYVSNILKKWLLRLDKIDIWSDVLAYDWMLFNKLIADYSNGYPSLPENINYIPFDIATLMKIKGVDPDINREEFAGLEANEDEKHNALWDAKVIMACYDKLMNKYEDV